MIADRERGLSRYLASALLVVVLLLQSVWVVAAAGIVPLLSRQRAIPRRMLTALVTAGAMFVLITDSSSKSRTRRYTRNWRTSRWSSIGRFNDDIALDEDALATLVDCHRELEATRAAPAILVGSTRDPDTGDHTYGGVVRTDRWRPMHYELIAPGDASRRVETMNGTYVLVPRQVASSVGNPAAAYTHGMGDYDYGHRATRADWEVWIAPGTIGTYARNPVSPRVASLDERRRRATSSTGGLPPSEWFTCVRRWAGPLWPVYAVGPHAHRFLRWAVKRCPVSADRGPAGCVAISSPG